MNITYNTMNTVILNEMYCQYKKKENAMLIKRLNWQTRNSTSNLYVPKNKKPSLISIKRKQHGDQKAEKIKSEVSCSNQEFRYK